MTEVRRRIKESQKQERRGAKLHGGRVQSGSGSQPGAKGDVRVSGGNDESRVTRGTLIEYKRTDAASIRLTTVMLEKIRTEALLEGRQHLLGFELGGRDYVVVPAERYAELEEMEQGADAVDRPAR